MTHPFPNSSEFQQLIHLAIREDMGPNHDDVTSRLAVDERLTGVGVVVQKQAGVVCGFPIVDYICQAYDTNLCVEILTQEGVYRDHSNRTPLIQITGPMRSLLSAERVILNILQRMSGVATLTHTFVQQTMGTRAKICDTRKTMPGFRALDKYAVLCGGGANHRIGLYDMVLIKDNHLAAYALNEIPVFLNRLIGISRSEDKARKIEVEVDTLEQLHEVLKVDGVDYILLDNMDCQTMSSAVEMRNALGKSGQVELEASGGVNLGTVRKIALTGVDRISIGAMTHSAPALDIGLDLRVLA